MSADGADEVALERVTVLRALLQLSAEDREALMLSVWDGMSYRSAAKVVGCSTAAFGVRLHRARRRLAAGLGEVEKRTGGDIEQELIDTEEKP